MKEDKNEIALFIFKELKNIITLAEEEEIYDTHKEQTRLLNAHEKISFIKSSLEYIINKIEDEKKEAKNDS